MGVVTFSGRWWAAVVLIAGFVPAPAHAAGTALTYQGRLEDAGTAAASYDFEVRLFGVANDGAALAGPFLFDDVPVDADGHFLLTIDPGHGTFTGADRWLELRVRRGTETTGFTLLSPRQPMHATPYAQHAADADFAALVAPGSVSSTELGAGAVTAAKIDATQVQRRVAGSCGAEEAIRVVNLDGSVACTATAAAANGWSLHGNAGTDPSTQFLGTTDATAFELRTHGSRHLRIQPSRVLIDGEPTTATMIGGSSANRGVEFRGATIGGGGTYAGSESHPLSDAGPNRVEGDYATVAGGAANRAGRTAAVGGGLNNDAWAGGSTVAGGEHNHVDPAAVYGAIGGGAENAVYGIAATVAGGNRNVVRGTGASVPGGLLNCAGGYASFAGGVGAIVRPARDPDDAAACDGLPAYPGGSGDAATFVWADSSAGKFVSSGSNQFLVRADGGVGINSSAIPSGTELTVASRTGPNGNVDVFLRTAAHARGINLAMLPGTGAAGFRIAQYDGVSFDDILILHPNDNFEVTAAALKPGGGSWSASSDARLKRDVRPLDDALERLLALRGVRFEYRTPDPGSRPPGRHDGFIAQEVAQVFPDWVGRDAQGYLTVGSRGFEALAVEAMRELRAERETADALQAEQLDALARENAQLRAQLTLLEQRLRALESEPARVR